MRRLALAGTLGLAGACGGAAGTTPASDGGAPDGAAPFAVTGCAPTPVHPVAPGGYTVNGNTICTGDGRPHLFHGLDRPSLEWSSGGENLSLADFRRMASWNANVVRVPLNQDFWLFDSPIADPNYPSLVDSVVAWAEDQGMDVILDLHASDRGVLGGCVPTAGCQQRMPDANSVTFWAEVAARYRNDGRVMFELYNEPHGVTWEIWRAGGDTSDGFRAVGMQELYDTVRAAGAENLVLVGGLDWAYDLSGVPAHRIDGYNIAYVTHPYNSGSRGIHDWDRAWGFLTETDPVVVTEFGDASGSCATDYSAALINYADAHAASWTAWGWFPAGCGFPSLIEDWTARPSPSGAVVKAALLGHGDPPASPPGAPAVSAGVTYAFDHGTEGWVLNTWDNPDLTNLAVHPPDGGVRPTLRHAAGSGDPDRGALRLTAAFTAPGQFATVDVAFGGTGQNLSCMKLHARIRLASGAAPAGGLELYACSTAAYVCSSVHLEASELPPGTWIPLMLDLAAPAPTGWNAAAVREIGVQILSSPEGDGGVSNDGVSDDGAAETVIELDSVVAG